LIIAPAMNQQMWRNEITQHNMTALQTKLGSRLQLIGPASGEQACGDIGPGRMVEPERIATTVMSPPATPFMPGTRVVITAGPTREALDPVRYISNHSSGKMGVALAEAAVAAGADVTLICGPVNIAMPANVTIIAINSAEEMMSATLERVSETDIFIAAAAVADYRPVHQAEEKIKKSGDQISLTLVKNPDIVATVASHPDRPFTVGFAAETQDLERYALGKLERKNLDMVIANDVSRTDIGFNSANNAVTVFWQQPGKPAGKQAFDDMPKQQLAEILIDTIWQQHQQHTGE